MTPTIPPLTHRVTFAVGDEQSARRISDLLSESLDESEAAVAAFEGPTGRWDISVHFAEAPDEGSIDIIGDGQQTRSFLFISECIEGTVRLMRSDVPGPLNIGSDEMVTIDHLADLIIDISGKTLRKNYIPGPIGVRGRNSDNRRIRTALGWAPSKSLRRGLEQTYAWIEMQVSAKRQ